MLTVNGNAGNTTGVWVNNSDRRLKRDIKPIPNALETVLKLQGKSFRWKDPQHDAKQGRVMGLIAQEVEPVLPQWVKNTGPNGTKQIEPIGDIALLIEAIKEQEREIKALKAGLEALREKESGGLSQKSERIMNHAE